MKKRKEKRSQNRRLGPIGVQKDNRKDVRVIRRVSVTHPTHHIRLFETFGKTIPRWVWDMFSISESIAWRILIRSLTGQRTCLGEGLKERNALVLAQQAAQEQMSALNG
jgi:hypothetical protein